MAKTKEDVLMPSKTRNKLFAAAIMLLISALMMLSSTYAWFTLSTAPEVRNITTTVAGNGSLELALMPTDGVLGNIKSGNSSLAAGGTVDVVAANTTWGNIVSLSDNSYGLGNIKLYPASLNKNEDGTLSDKPIAVPVYGGDGRIEKLDSEKIGLNSYNATAQAFNGTAYGVRAITETSGTEISEYGYVVDLAVRLNTTKADGTNGKLLLQTAEKQRIYGDSNNAETLGGGSYMEFTTVGGDLSDAMVKNLMKSITVTFVANYGNSASATSAIVATGKLDVDGMTATAAPYKAALYLVDAAGAKLEGNNAVILDSLQKNAPAQISAIVWLDGETIKNADVSATALQSLVGTLNLQFTTDIDLVSHVNTPLKGETTTQP